MREIAWKDLNHIVAQLKIAVEHKDDEWFADYLIEALWVMVNEHGNKKVFGCGDGEFIVETEAEANAIADLFEAAGLKEVNTGWYDPVEDERDGCVDELTGRWYVR